MNIAITSAVILASTILATPTSQTQFLGTKPITTKAPSSFQIKLPPAPVVAPQPPADPPSPAQPPVSSAVDQCGDNEFARYIYQHESGCRTSAPNGSGCDGIGQACPASKVIGPCGYDYACQNAWFTDYANRAYGGWEGAYNFWLSNHWW